VAQEQNRRASELVGVLSGLASTAGGFGSPCNSFDDDTLVATAAGVAPIITIQVGDQVLAWHQETGEVGYYTVTATHSHLDPVVVYLTINDETILTTPEHPFYTVAGEWVGAGDLQVGSRVYSTDGQLGVVAAVKVVEQPQVMYNLTVADAHTFAVGDGQWLVHNVHCLLNSIEDSPNYPKGFVHAQDGKNKVTVNNKGLLSELRSVGGRNWSKVYQDGYDAYGNKVSIHYFQDESGRVFDVDLKQGWSNRSSK
jgi:Pretoxin HINT domain